jgi:hypothetical protein
MYEVQSERMVGGALVQDQLVSDLEAELRGEARRPAELRATPDDTFIDRMANTPVNAFIARPPEATPVNTFLSIPPDVS